MSIISDVSTPNNKMGGEDSILSRPLYDRGDIQDYESRMNALEQHDQGNKVQYLYQMQGLPRMSFTQLAGTTSVITPTIPLNSFSSMTGLVWFYNNSGNVYQLQEYRSYLVIYVPSNITINRLTLYTYAAPVYTNATTAGGVPSSATFLQAKAIKVYLGSIASQIPYTYAPLAVDFLNDPIIQRPQSTGTDVTTTVLGASSWAPPTANGVNLVSNDMASLFSPGDHTLLEFRETTGSSTTASASTLFVYAVLEGYVRNS